MKRILLVRHGESEWNAVRRLQGQADIGLSSRGADQVAALREVVTRLQPDRAVTSDLQRARHTAELLGFPEAGLVPALREVHVGDWTGQAIADLIAAGPDDYRAWRAGTFTPPGGEGWSTFCDRVAGGVEAAIAETRERLLVVCHGAVIRALLDRMVGLPPSRILPVGPASLTILARRDEVTRLEVFNFNATALALDAPD
jgi:glucosyl-3-phosphoglycerate phosphatase